MTEIIKPKRWYWLTPNGVFNCSNEAGILNNCSGQMIRNRCNKKVEGYLKVIEQLSTITCKTCGIKHPLNEKLVRSEIKKGKRYFLRECKTCQRVRDTSSNLTESYVYIFKDENNEVVYVGKTYQLSRRIRRHFNENPLQWKQDFTGIIEVAKMSNKADASIMELYLISKLNPKYNQRDNEGDVTNYELPTPKFEFYRRIK